MKLQGTLQKEQEGQAYENESAPRTTPLQQLLVPVVTCRMDARHRTCGCSTRCLRKVVTAQPSWPSNWLGKPVQSIDANISEAAVRYCAEVPRKAASKEEWLESIRRDDAWRALVPVWLLSSIMRKRGSWLERAGFGL